MAEQKKNITSTVAKLIEQANQSNSVDEFGKCEWVDLDGKERCNSPWSEFQCQQVGGTFSSGGKCDSSS